MMSKALISAAGLVIGLLYGWLLLATMQMQDGKWLQFTMLASAGILLAIITHMIFKELSKAMLFMLIFSIPVVYNINFFYHYDEPVFVTANGIPVALYDLLLVPMIMWLWMDGEQDSTAKLSGQRASIPGAFWVFAMALFLMNLTSALLSEQAFYSFSMLFVCIKAFVFAAFLGAYIHSEHQLKTVTLALSLALLAQGIIAAEQKFVGKIFTEELLGRDVSIQSLVGDQLIERVAGTMTHPNDLAMFINILLLIIIFSFPLLKSLRTKIGLSICIVLAFMTEIWTASRGGWVAFAVALYICSLALARKRGYNTLVIAVGLAAVFATMIGALYVVSEDFRLRLVGEDYGTADLRIPLMQVATNMIEQNPIMGVGLNNYAFHMQAYDNTAEYVSRYYNYPVHNTFLLIGAETGLITLFLTIGLLLWVIYKAYIIFMRSTGHIELMALGIMGGIMSWMVHNLTNLDAIYGNTSLWMCIGITLALDRMLKSKAHVCTH